MSCTYANPAGCFTAGQCTRYVWSRRPDLPCNLGNADTWAQLAAQQGFPTSHTPHVGDAIQYPGGYAGADSVGHVAYCESVNSDGSITVSEMNWCASFHVDFRNVQASVVPGLWFIGKKGQPAPTPAPPPPVSPPSPPPPAGSDLLPLLLITGGSLAAFFYARKENIKLHVDPQKGTSGGFGGSTLRVERGVKPPPTPRSTTPRAVAFTS